MRVAILCIGDVRRLESAAEGLARGFAAQGHRPERLKVPAEAGRLPAFDFLACLAAPGGAFGAPPIALSETVADLPGLQGKRCAAYLLRGGLLPEKSLVAFMARLESGGAKVVAGDIVKDGAGAEAAARQAPVERKR